MMSTRAPMIRIASRAMRLARMRLTSPVSGMPSAPSSSS